MPPHQDINHSNGNLTAVHESVGADLERHPPSIRAGPYDGADLKHWSTNSPEKILHTIMETDDRTVALWNVRAVPANPWGEEKVKLLEAAYERIKATSEPPARESATVARNARQYTSVPTDDTIEYLVMTTTSTL